MKEGIKKRRVFKQGVSMSPSSLAKKLLHKVFAQRESSRIGEEDDYQASQDEEEDHQGPPPAAIFVLTPVRRRNVRLSEKWAMISEIRQRIPVGSKPTEVVYIEVGRKFHRSPSTIRTVWSDFVLQVQQNPQAIPDMNHYIVHPKEGGGDDDDDACHQRKPVGRPSQLTPGIQTAIANAAKRNHYRTTLRALRDELRNPPVGHPSYNRALSTLHRYLRKLNYKRHRAYVKPTLRPGNKEKRLRFILQDRLEPDPVSAEHYRFKSLDNVVFVDEKYFPLFQPRYHVWAPPSVAVPPVHAQSKTHVPALMYLTAVMKPSVDPATGIYNDGKIAMIPFANEVPAKRDSRNRPAGTLELKPYSCTSESFYNVMTRPDGLMNRVRQKLNHLENQEITVVLQMDNAPPHVGKHNIDRLNAFGEAQQGMKIRVVLQAPQSPDFNVLDLALFHALNAGTIAYRQGVQNYRQLNNNLQHVFATFPNDMHERAYAKLLDIYRATLKIGGGNTYSLPHRGVRNRQNDGLPVLDYLVDIETVDGAKAAYNLIRNQHAFAPHLLEINDDE